jgi:hypothetical protein
MSINDQGLASRDDAYHAIAPSLNARRAQVLGLVIESGKHGVTLDELSALFGVAPNSISGRISELKRLGLVVHKSARRPTRSGSSASVIVALTSGSYGTGAWDES